MSALRRAIRSSNLENQAPGAARNFLLQKTLLFLEILGLRFMSAYKIFISSPGDVGRERHLAEQVIRRVAAEFQNRVEVQPYFWEYEPMESTRDYQENIPLTSAFDLVICILWKRLGSPLSVNHQRPEGGQWRSGTEFELVTAVESKKARGAPDIFIFKNDTKPTFEADEAGEGAKTELDLAQWKALIAFIKEWCEGVQDGQRVFYRSAKPVPGTGPIRAGSGKAFGWQVERTLSARI